MVEFKIPKAERVLLAEGFMKRVLHILKENKVDANPQIVAEFIEKYFPDWRRILNELQRFSAGGEINVGILQSISDKSFQDLIPVLKSKRFGDIRKWVVENLDNDPALLYRKLYDTILSHVKPECIPSVVLHIGEYSYQSAFVVDQEITLVCCLLKLAIDTEWVN